MNNIVIEEYNPDWAKEFTVLKSVYEVILKDYSICVEHVGSTSVQGLAAKPILDIDIIAHKNEELLSIIRALEEVGYIHIGDMGIIGREAFKRKTSQVPIQNHSSYTFEHNLYVCQKDSLALRNHLLFRNYLKKNSAVVAQYADLKKELAAQYLGAIDLYCEAKTEFITDALKKAGLDESDLGEITRQNTLEK